MHFEDVASLALPVAQRLPKLQGIDYFAGTEPYKGRVGGDHLAVVNFGEYNLRKKIKESYEAKRQDLAAALEKNLSRFGIYNGEVTPALFVLFKASSRLSIFPETMSFLSLHLCFSVRNYPQFSHIGLALLTCSPIPSLCLVMYSKIPIIYF